MSASPQYQSRLFNFLTDRAVRWGDRAAQAWRHAQIAATTVARTVLLPLWAIAENLGIHPPQLPGFGASFTDRSVFSPGVDEKREGDLAVDAPILATLTILEAAGWLTVDRLDREALQPAQTRPEVESREPPEAQKKAKHWFQALWAAVIPTQPNSQTHPEPPAPLALQLSERELRAIAPASKQASASPVRGLASELGRTDLVLISADNEIVAYLGLFPQQTLDRDVEILLTHLAPIALPPARSGLAALPTSIGQAVQAVQAVITPLVSPLASPVQGLLTRLDGQLANLDARSIQPSGFAIARTFDLHAEFTETALESAIETPLEELCLFPASNLEVLGLSFQSSFQSSFQAFTRSLQPSPEETPESPDRASRTAIEGSQWSIDPADPWWRNAIDLARAAIAGAVTAIVPVAKPPSEMFNTETLKTGQFNTDYPAELADRLGQADRPLRSKTVNRLRDWLGDRSDRSDPSDHSDRSNLTIHPDQVKNQATDQATDQAAKFWRNDGKTAIAPTAADESLAEESFKAPQTFSPTTGKAIANPATSTIATPSHSRQTQGGMEFDPDWIDANVKDSQYVMHPLERVLRWLDRAMAAIEGWVERAIEAVAQWWSRRRAS